MNEQYHRFNENLMSNLNSAPVKENGLKPDFKMPATPVANETPQPSMPKGEGTIIVEVTIARQAIPVEGAKVIVSSENNGEVIATEITDKSGRTRPLKLSAPSSSLSQTPNSAIRPYTTYNIQVEYPGYYIENAIDVPVFDKIRSIQPIFLIPLSEKDIAEGELLIKEDQVLNS